MVDVEFYPGEEWLSESLGVVIGENGFTGVEIIGAADSPAFFLQGVEMVQGRGGGIDVVGIDQEKGGITGPLQV
jgi:hypothetical protein